MDAAVPNETHARASRVAHSGRLLTYELEIIQQPSRARACGSGQKSSADRRPVDPPPIVRVQIFDGPGDDPTDVTFTMNANYFLFATLDELGTKANGRALEQTRPAVLTGTPVAGMVLLDKPTAAGYFLFPDLSVRHEGDYRLNFSLYEELKSLSDEDPAAAIPGSPSVDHGHVTHRLEVKSVPFTVYSAKKFPGLTESTDLSRAFADQGCRVRIRKDVRVRRRNVKPDRSREGFEAGVWAGPRAMSSERELGPRPRSSSNVGPHAQRPPPSLSRRSSLQELKPSVQSAYSGPSHATLMPALSAAARPPSPTQQYPPSSYAARPPANSLPSAPYVKAPLHHAQAQSAPNGYASAGPSPPQTHYGAAPPPVSSFEQAHAAAEARRASMSTPSLPPPPALIAPQNGISISQAYHVPAPLRFPSSYPPPSMATQYPMIAPAPLDPYAHRPMPTEPPTTAGDPSLTKPLLRITTGRSPPPPGGPFSPPIGTADTTGSKRSYSDAFDSAHSGPPLRHLIRPLSLGDSSSSAAVIFPAFLPAAPPIEADDRPVEDAYAYARDRPPWMNYKRSNGAQVQRSLPAFRD